MALATDAPARLDLSFRTNDDERFGVSWSTLDGAPIEVNTAVVTLQCDLPPPEPLPDPPPDPLPPPPDPVRIVIDATDPADPNGYIDPDLLEDGIVMVTVAHGVWATVEERTGSWDLLAVNTAGLTRCLARGLFIVEEGIS